MIFLCTYDKRHCWYFIWDFALILMWNLSSLFPDTGCQKPQDMIYVIILKVYVLLTSSKVLTLWAFLCSFGFFWILLAREEVARGKDFPNRLGMDEVGVSVKAALSASPGLLPALGDFNNKELFSVTICWRDGLLERVLDRLRTWVVAVLWEELVLESLLLVLPL